jgi:hypothetical protein
LVAVVTSPQPAAAQKKAAPKAPRVYAYRVQIRQPGWRVVAVVPDGIGAARAVAARYRARGFSTQVKHYRTRAVVRARMPRWHTRAVVVNPAVAQGLARLGIAQGFQTRIVPIRIH